MKDRLLKIITALNNNVINLDNFDGSFANEKESNHNQKIDEELV